MKYILSLIVFLTLSVLGQDVSQELFNNQVPNSGFEKALTGYSFTASTMTLESSDVGRGAKSGKFDPTAASQFMSSKLSAIPKSLYGKNCLASLVYKGSGGAANIKMQAYDGTNVLNEQTLPIVTSYTSAELNFPCPSSGSLQVRLFSDGNASFILVDDLYLGKASNIGTVSQATLVVQAYQESSNCNPARTNAAFGVFSTDVDCPANVVEVYGDSILIDTADTDLPKITLLNAPPGNYLVTATVVASNSGAAFTTGLQINDGVTGSGNILFAPSATTDYGAISIQGTFKYTTGGNKTFELYGRSGGGGTISLSMDGSGGGGRLTWKIQKMPLESQTVIKPEDSGWYIDANIGGANVDLGTGANSTYSQISNSGLNLVKNAGSSEVQIACDAAVSTGLTCSGNELYGITISPPRTGSIEVCAYVTTSIAGSGAELAYEIVQTTEGSSATVLEGNARQAITANSSVGTEQVNQSVCGIFQVTSIGRKSYKLYFEKTASTGQTIITDRAVGAGQRDMHWTVTSLVNQQQAIIVDQVVTAGLNDQANVVSANITNTGTPSLTAQVGNWHSSFTDNGVGDITFNIVAGTFSSAPVCTVSSVKDNTGSTYCRMEGFPSTSAARVLCLSSVAGSLTDANFALQCHGAR